MSATGKLPGRAGDKTPILLVDDHPLVRERLAEVINRESDLVVCGEAEARDRALEAVAATAPALVIIDLTLKNSDGIELIKDIRCRWPRMLMLVVSMHDEALYAERSLRAGARGYITKQEATRNILLAIRRVLQGDIYLSPELSSSLISRALTSSPAQAPAALLADRELQVFQLTGQGLPIRQIARRLHISSKTVETYRARIREKLQLKDGSDLLQTAIAWTHRG